MPLLKTNDEIRGLLRRTRTIAVVGLSGDPSRDSHGVAEYLQGRDYSIIGVNPKYREVLGVPVYPSLEAIPPLDLRAVDLVDVFRRPEEAAAVAREAGRLKIPAIWFQLGVATPEAIAEAERAGMDVVAESCIKVAHMLLKPWI